MRNTMVTRERRRARIETNRMLRWYDIWKYNPLASRANPVGGLKCT